MILVPPQIINIPQYMFFRYFNPFWIYHPITGSYIYLINTGYTMYAPAITANGIRSGLCIFIFRQSFRGLPKELEDAAYLDGCSPFKTFLKVMVPNAGSTFLTVFLFSIVWYWNDYYVSTSFFTDNKTIALMLQRSLLSGWRQAVLFQFCLFFCFIFFSRKNLPRALHVRDLQECSINFQLIHIEQLC